MTDDSPIVLYDADCGFCSSAVQFILRHETHPVLKFAPLNGETARRLGIARDNAPNSIVLVDSGQHFLRSRAVWGIMYYMGGRWRRMGARFSRMPRGLSDTGYRIVARIRRQLPGGNSCLVPDPATRSRFLP